MKFQENETMGFNLSKLQFGGSSFTGCLKNSNFSNCDLTCTYFLGADLSGADFGNIVIFPNVIGTSMTTIFPVFSFCEGVPTKFSLDFSVLDLKNPQKLDLFFNHKVNEDVGSLLTFLQGLPDSWSHFRLPILKECILFLNQLDELSIISDSI